MQGLGLVWWQMDRDVDPFGPGAAASKNGCTTSGDVPLSIKRAIFEPPKDRPLVLRLAITLIQDG